MAQTDSYLIIDEAPGESADKTYKDAIDVESWSWGETNTGSSAHGGGAGQGKVLPQDMSIIKHVDKSSAVLFINCSTGTPFEKAVLVQRKAGEGQLAYLIITLTNVMVSSYQVSGSGDGGAIPTESIGLNFDSLEMVYKPQDEKGGLGGEIKQTYSFKTNEKL